MEQHLHSTEKHTAHGSVKSCVIGFILSIGLTLLAFYFVSEHIFSGLVLNTIIILLSIIQVVVQLIFFLHLGEDSKPYWNILAFLFMVLVVAIIVPGSLWIMNNLNYRMMPEMKNKSEIYNQAGLPKIEPNKSSNDRQNNDENLLHAH